MQESKVYGLCSDHLVGQSCTRNCIKWEVEICRERMSLNIMFCIQFTVWACGWYWLAVQLWTTSAFNPPLRRYRMIFHECTKSFLTPPCRQSLTHAKQEGHQSGFKVYSYEYIMLRFIQSHYACDYWICISTSTLVDGTIPRVIVCCHLAVWVYAIC